MLIRNFYSKTLLLISEFEEFHIGMAIKISLSIGFSNFFRCPQKHFSAFQWGRRVAIRVLFIKPIKYIPSIIRNERSAKVFQQDNNNYLSFKYGCNLIFCLCNFSRSSSNIILRSLRSLPVYQRVFT